jgi:sugar lactone lactonase YvrE
MNKRLIFYVLILFLVLVQFSFAEESENASDKRSRVRALYQKATKLHEQKDYDAYLETIKKALSIFSVSCNLKYHLARAYALTNKKKEALDTLTPLVELGIFLEVDTEKDFANLKEEKAFIRLLEKVKKLKEPVINSTLAFVVPEKDLIPEGVAYDRVEKAFYLSSLEKSKIIKIDRNGKISDFVASRQDGLLPTVGMAIDAKRRVLWVCNGFGYPKEGMPQELFGTSGIFKYDLKTGKLIKKYMLSQKENHFLNDVTVAPDGRVFISDSHVPAIYTIDPKKDVIEKFVVLKDRYYPNGIAYSPDSNKVYVSSSTEITVVDATNENMWALKHPKNFFISSNDGLYYYKNSLIGIQNTVGKGRIIRVKLDQSQQAVTGLEILESRNPMFNIPTTGVIADGIFYFMANTQLHLYDDNGKLPPINTLDEVKVLKLKLAE